MCKHFREIFGSWTCWSVRNIDMQVKLPTLMPACAEAAFGSASAPASKAIAHAARRILLNMLDLLINWFGSCWMAVIRRR